MSTSVKATLVPDFDHFATILLPDGRSFQVSYQDVEQHVGDIFLLRPDALIRAVFGPKVKQQMPTVMVPQEVLDRLPK